jgi:hypothetical protein
MKFIPIIVAGSLIAASVSGQSTLSAKLWEMVESCKSNLEDFNGDGKTDYEIFVDDSKNGYLRIKGSFPTCGCECDNTVGAYKSKNGDYVLLKQQNWSCDWHEGVSANRDLVDVFPEGFDITAFNPRAPRPSNDGCARFYLAVEIPQKGTDTRITLKMVPFGMRVESDRLMSYELKGAEGTNRNLGYIRQIADSIIKEETFDLIITNEFSKISAADLMIIDGLIPSDDNGVSGREQLRKELNRMKQTYYLYTGIQSESLIFGWDREKGRFFIKSKGEPPAPITFREFLRKASYWYPIC